MLRSKAVGGLEPRLEKEARALADAGYEVHAIVWDRERAYAEEEQRGGFTVHRVRYAAPYNRPALAWKLPGWWRRADRILRTLRPAVVHAADYDTAPPALRARRAWGAKFVFDVWDLYADMVTANLPRFVRRSLERREARAVEAADLVILPDLARRPRLRAEPRRLIEVMNVPEDRTIAPQPHNRFTLFYGGNLAKDRGLLDLLVACEAAGAALIVAGQGPDEATLVPAIESSPNALYLGVVAHEEVLRQTAGADAIPALYDPNVPNNRLASPNKLYEALMLARPVIASEGTGIADFVRSERIGLVVPYGDAERLRAALERLMGSPQDCAEMGARGRRLYEARFRWETMAERLVDAYRSLVCGPCRSPW